MTRLASSKTRVKDPREYGDISWNHTSCDVFIRVEHLSIARKARALLYTSYPAH